MAGEWIKMKKCLRDEPEVIGIASALDLDEDAVVGKLHALWAWADTVLRSGYAASVTKTWVDRHVRASGFADAMVLVGWLVIHEGGIEFPNYDRHMSKNAKQRALTANRMEVSRLRNSDAASVTQSSPEKRREEDIEEPPYIPPVEEKPPSKPKAPKQPKDPIPPLPSSIDTPAVRAAWDEFVQYRRQRREPMTALTAKRHFTMLEKLGPVDAERSIRQSLAGEWRGLFPPKGAAKTPPRPGQQFDPNHTPGESF